MWYWCLLVVHYHNGYHLNIFLMSNYFWSRNMANEQILIHLAWQSSSMTSSAGLSVLCGDTLCSASKCIFELQLLYMSWMIYIIVRTSSNGIIHSHPVTACCLQLSDGILVFLFRVGNLSRCSIFPTRGLLIGCTFLTMVKRHM